MGTNRSGARKKQKARRTKKDMLRIIAKAEAAEKAQGKTAKK